MDGSGSTTGSDPLTILEKPSWEIPLKDLHHKFTVIDNKSVITGSFNWSPSAAHTNDESLLVIHSTQPNSPNTSPEKWIDYVILQNWGSHRSSRGNSTVKRVDAEME